MPSFRNQPLTLNSEILLFVSKTPSLRAGRGTFTLLWWLSGPVSYKLGFLDLGCPSNVLQDGPAWDWSLPASPVLGFSGVLWDSLGLLGSVSSSVTHLMPDHGKISPFAKGLLSQKSFLHGAAGSGSALASDPAEPPQAWLCQAGGST